MGKFILMDIFYNKKTISPYIAIPLGLLAFLLTLWIENDPIPALITLGILLLLTIPVTLYLVMREPKSGNSFTNENKNKSITTFLSSACDHCGYENDFSADFCADCGLAIRYRKNQTLIKK